MSDGAEPAHDPAATARVRRELAHLGTDADSAPEVPPEVTARVGAALRNAPHPAAHTLPRPKLTRPQRAGVLVGTGAVGTAVIVGALTLVGDPAPTFPTGPTASQITVDRPTDVAFPLADHELRAALAATPDLGPLADPQRRASCLAGLGYDQDREMLGGRQLEVWGRPAVLMLLAADAQDRVDAVAVEPGCSAANTGLLAETSIRR